MIVNQDTIINYFLPTTPFVSQIVHGTLLMKPATVSKQTLSSYMCVFALVFIYFFTQFRVHFPLRQ